MKISQEEIDAVHEIFMRDVWAGPSQFTIVAALQAFGTIRRARKQAKRERQRKEKDKHVQDSAKGEIVKPSESASEAMYRAHGYSIPSKAPEWDGNASAFDAAMKPKA